MTEQIRLAGRRLLKGHVAQHTALVLLDPSNEITLSVDDIQTACSPLTGGGTDSFLRLVRTAELPGAEAFLEVVPEAQWFLEAHFSDAAPWLLSAEGLLLAAEALVHEGELNVADGEALVIGTRAGARTLTRLGGLWTLDLGAPHYLQPEGAQADPREEAWDTAVCLPGLEGARAALSLDIAGPSAVLPLASEEEWESLSQVASVAEAPTAAQTYSMQFDAEPRLGPATHLVVVLPLDEELEAEEGTRASESESDADGSAEITEDRLGRARLRLLAPVATAANATAPAKAATQPHLTIHPAATAASSCAVAVALHEWEGEDAPRDYLLDVPGGQYAVHVGAAPLEPGASILLTASATITASVTLA